MHNRRAATLGRDRQCAVVRYALVIFGLVVFGLIHRRKFPEPSPDMVKHSPSLMSGFFTSATLWPAASAGFTGCSSAFLAQCLWLVERGWRTGSVDPEEIYRLERGTSLWKHRGVLAPAAETPPAFETELNASDSNSSNFPQNGSHDPNHSPLWYLIAAAPLLLSPVSLRPESIHQLHLLAAAPYIIFGLVLGASLWYVSRRLFGNAGDMSRWHSTVFRRASCAQRTLVRGTGGRAAWGAFGAVFTAIAVAHTLYAPREVILWNWRRIVLLGLSLALAVGSQFSLIILAPVALGFMLYLAVTRRAAAVAIWVVPARSVCCFSMRPTSSAPVSFGKGSRTHLFSASRGQRSLCPWPIASAGSVGTEQPRLGGGASGCVDCVCLLAASPLLRKYGVLIGGRFVPGAGRGHAALPRAGLPVDGDSVPVRLCCRDCGRPSGKSLPADRSGRHLGLLVANSAWNLWELARVGRG